MRTGGKHTLQRPKTTPQLQHAGPDPFRVLPCPQGAGRPRCQATHARNTWLEPCVKKCYSVLLTLTTVTCQWTRESARESERERVGGRGRGIQSHTGGIALRVIQARTLLGPGLRDMRVPVKGAKRIEKSAPSHVEGMGCWGSRSGGARCSKMAAGNSTCSPPRPLL
jgi:hypothetical protein